MVELVLSYGPLHRIWPSSGARNDVYVSVSAIRSVARPVCKLLKSENMGNSWFELADFHLMDPRNTATGKPFVSAEGSIMVPVWNAGFYEYGRTWLAIYRSDDCQSWRRVYSNTAATYGNHFFQGTCENEIFLCAGLGGGGSDGKVRYAPAKGLLLRSQDSGRHWESCLEVEGPTALYDGTASGGALIVSARERGSIYRSENKGETWNEVFLGAPARNVRRIDEKVVVSSDGAIFLSSDDGSTWIKQRSPLSKLVFRYPTPLGDKMLMTGVGWRSLVLATDLKRNGWQISFDATRVARTKLMTRLAIVGDHLFLGDELEIGALLRVSVDSLKGRHPFPYSILDRLASNQISRFERPRT